MGKCCSVANSCLTLCNPMDCSMPGYPVLHCFPEFSQIMSIGDNYLNMSSSAMLFSFCLQSFPSIRAFFSESAFRIRWPKYWSFGFSNSPSSEYSGLISFKINWFALLAVQGLSRVFSNTTVQKHQFFSVQPSLWSNSHIHT